MSQDINVLVVEVGKPSSEGKNYCWNQNNLFDKRHIPLAK